MVGLKSPPPPFPKGDLTNTTVRGKAASPALSSSLAVFWEALFADLAGRPEYGLPIPIYRNLEIQRSESFWPPETYTGSSDKQPVNSSPAPVGTESSLERDVRVRKASYASLALENKGLLV